jgi:hypothetical protein
MAYFGDYNAADLPTNTMSSEPVPAGWYSVKIHSAEVKNTKAGTGQYIAVRYDILGPTHQGRVVFGNLNIKNPNPKAEEIGRQQLGDLMRSIGLAKVNDTDQLVGGSLKIKVDVRKDEQYGDSNDVRGYKAIEGSMPSVTATSTLAPQAARAPWQK